MKKLLLSLAVAGLITACYENAPVYFPRPLGRPADGFDESFHGVYFDLNNITEDWLDEMGERIETEGDSALMEEFASRLGITDREEDPSAQQGVANKNEETESTQRKSRRQKTEDSLAIEFNPSVSEIISSAAASYLDHANYYAYKLDENELRLFIVDTHDTINSYPLIQLSDSVKLTTYDDRYFLNFGTPLGWEIIQIQQIAPDILAFKAIGAPVSTDPPPRDLESLEESVEDYYRYLRTLVDEDGQVVGFRARLRKRKVIETFDTKETPWLRLISVF